MPLEALARPQEGGNTREETSEGLCAELWGLLYSPDYQLKLRIPDTLLFCNGSFDSRLYTAQTGAIRQSLQGMDNAEQTNRICRAARPDPRGAVHRAVLRYDDEQVRLVGESAIPRVLRMLNSRNNKSSVIVHDTEYTHDMPPQWQCIRSYIHPLHDSVLTCTFSRDPSRRPKELVRNHRTPAPKSHPNAKSKVASADEWPQHFTTTAYSFSRRYLELDTNEISGRVEDPMYDRPQDVAKRAEPKDMRDIAESLVRETERTLEKIVSFLEKVESTHKTHTHTHTEVHKQANTHTHIHTHTHTHTHTHKFSLTHTHTHTHKHSHTHIHTHTHAHTHTQTLTHAHKHTYTRLTDT
jgi:hypothetical protein